MSGKKKQAHIRPTGLPRKSTVNIHALQPLPEKEFVEKVNDILALKLRATR